MTREHYNGLPNTPDDLPEPFEDDGYRGDDFLDAHPDRGESEADRIKWRMTSDEFVKRWRHLLFGEGALSRKQAGG
jgi:hypothetical protein